MMASPDESNHRIIADILCDLKEKEKKISDDDYELIEELLKNCDVNAPVNSNKDTLLHIAVREEYNKLFKIFLKNKGNVTIVNNFYESPYDLAVKLRFKIILNIINALIIFDDLDKNIFDYITRKENKKFRYLKLIQIENFKDFVQSTNNNEKYCKIFPNLYAFKILREVSDEESLCNNISVKFSDNRPILVYFSHSSSIYYKKPNESCVFEKLNDIIATSIRSLIDKETFTIDKVDEICKTDDIVMMRVLRLYETSCKNEIKIVEKVLICSGTLELFRAAICEPFHLPMQNLNKKLADEICKEKIIKLVVKYERIEILLYLIDNFIISLRHLSYDTKKSIIDFVMKKKENEKFLCELLKFDFPFPSNFNETQFKDIEELIKDRKTLLFSNDIDQVKKFVKINTFTKIGYQNKNNMTALFFYAVENQNIEIYCYLKSIGFTTDSNDEIKKIKEELKNNNEVKVFNEKYGYSDSNNHLRLLTNIIKIYGHYSEEEYLKFYALLDQTLEDLNKNEVIKKILIFCAETENLRVTFDFKNNDLRQLDPTSDDSTGVTYPNGSIFIANPINEYVEKDIKLNKTLIHELVHFAMRAFFKNNSRPYYAYDKTGSIDFENITKNILKFINTNNRDDLCDGIISDGFNYPNTKHQNELIVRVFEIFASSTKQKIIELRQHDAYKQLFRYANEYVANELSIEELKMRTKVRDLNGFIGQSQKIIEKNKFFKILEKSDCNKMIDKILKDANNQLIVTNFPIFALSNIEFNFMKTYESLYHAKNIFLNPENLKNEKIFDEFCFIEKILKNVVIDFSIEHQIRRFPKNGKLIFVTTENNFEKVKEYLKANSVSFHENSEIIKYQWKDLTSETQTKLITAQVTFQGKTFQLNEIFDEILINDSFVDDELFLELCNQKKIEINTKLYDMDNIDSYVERKVMKRAEDKEIQNDYDDDRDEISDSSENHPAHSLHKSLKRLKKNLLNDDDDSNEISDSSENHPAHSLHKSLKRLKKNLLNDDDDRDEISDSSENHPAHSLHKSLKRLMKNLLNDDDDSDEISDSSENHPAHSLHKRLKRLKKNLLNDDDDRDEISNSSENHPAHSLLKSLKSLRNKLFNHDDNKNKKEEEFAFSCKDFITKVETNEKILISDIAGSGKSYFLKKISFSLMEECVKNNIYWVLFIDLRKILGELREWPQKKNFLEFFQTHLGKEMRNYQKKIFDNLFIKGKVKILMDGFDEISKNCGETVVKLIETMFNNQVWITTRNHHKIELQKRLKINETFFLKPLENREEFLINYWEKRGISPNETVDNHAKDLLKKFDGIKSDTTNLIGSMQQLKILAEICVVNKFVVIDSHSELTIYDIFKKSIEQHIDKFNKREQCVDLINKIKLGSHTDFIKVHQYHAFLNIIDSEIVEKIFAHFGKLWSLKEVEDGGLATNENGTIDFIHKTYEEFFQANFVIDSLVKNNHWEYFDIVIGLFCDMVCLPSYNTVQMFINDEIQKLNFDEETIEFLAHYFNKKIKNIKILNLSIHHNHENTLKFLLRIIEHVYERIRKSIFTGEGSEEYPLFVSITSKNPKIFFEILKLTLQYLSEDEFIELINKKCRLIDLNIFYYFDSEYATVEMIQALMNEIEKKLNEEKMKEILLTRTSSFTFLPISDIIKATNSDNLSKFKYLWGLYSKYVSIKELIENSDNIGGGNILRVIARNKEIDVHISLWERLETEFKTNESMIDSILLQPSKIDEINFMYYLIIQNDSIEILLFHIFKIIDICNNPKTILTSKGADGKNLLQKVIIQRKSFDYFVTIWNLFKDNIEHDDFLAFITAPDKYGGTIFYDTLFTIIRNQNNSEIFETEKILNFIIESSEKYLGVSPNDIKSYIKEAIKTKNLLHYAEKKNRSIDIHIFLWNFIEKYFNDDKSEIIDLISKNENHCSLDLVLLHNSLEVINFTWEKIKFYINDQNGQKEYLEKNNLQRLLLKDCVVKENENWLRDLINSYQV